MIRRELQEDAEGAEEERPLPVEEVGHLPLLGRELGLHQDLGGAQPSRPPPLERWWPDVPWTTAAEDPLVATRMDE